MVKIIFVGKILGGGNPSKSLATKGGNTQTGGDSGCRDKLGDIKVSFYSVIYSTG